MTCTGFTPTVPYRLLPSPPASLYLFPQRIQLVETRLAHFHATLARHLLDGLEAMPEFPVRELERVIGIDPELPGEVHRREQEIADFRGHLEALAARGDVFELRHL